MAHVDRKLGSEISGSKVWTGVKSGLGKREFNFGVAKM